MTTVVWDGVTLVADRKGVDSWGMKSEVCKIHEGPDWVMGASGEHAQIVKWHSSICNKKFHELPRVNGLIVYDDYKKDENDPGIILISRENGAHFHSQGIFLPTFDRRRYVIGSGRDFALGALMAGVDAMTALKIAASFDNGTGDTFDAFDVGHWAFLPSTK